MVIKKKSRQGAAPLIIEGHPTTYTGYPFITLIQYRKSHVLAIVDNSDNQTIKSYVLDLCPPEKVNEELIIEVASYWYNNTRTQYPLSIEFSKRGMSGESGKIYRTFNIEFVTRVIGPLPRFEMMEVTRVKRRKRKPISPHVEITKKLTS